ncbi:hypothetical protein QOZ80_3AG0224690 [Eleusine coracana subsp. coracana]|nr:hypothetical protein QOZ80_3AG0224690 [Eleusine coracana subsp. coracana]
MERASASSRRAAAAVVTTALLALCCGAARPLGRPHEVVTLTPEALPPASWGYGDAAARAGKWLPFAGGGIGFPHHHIPAAFFAHKPMPWLGFRAAGAHDGAGAGAFEGGGGEEEEELVRERSYERDERDRRDRQEELAMWASLLNPKSGKRRAEAAGWLPAQGIGEEVDEERAKASSDGAFVEGEDPAANGVQTKSGFYWGNNGN